MIFNQHFRLADSHASILTPSRPHWLKYDDDKLDRVFASNEAAKLGTRKHDLAAQLIELGQKLPENQQTLNMYVNDAIGYRMQPEQTLFYSENCFGKADAIIFRNNMLRIHDLKTGVTQTNMIQLEVYMAIFCLEYRFKPFDIKAELRIYQSDDVKVHIPDPLTINNHMEAIKYLDKRIELLKEVSS